MLRDESFKFGGNIMGHIARHSQFVFSGLAQFIKCFLCGVRLEKLQPSVEDIPDYDVQEVLKLAAAGNQLSKTHEKSLSDYILEARLHTDASIQFDQEAGINRIVDNRDEIIETLTFHYAITKRSAQLQQLRDGFNEVCNFTAFYKTGVLNDSSNVFKSLVTFLFPPTCEVTTTRMALEKSFHVTTADEVLREKMFNVLEKIISSLDENPCAPNSTSKFVQLCTAKPYLKDGEEITFEIKEACMMKPGKPVELHSCFKTVYVSEAGLENEDSMTMLVEHIKITAVNGSWGFDVV